jgi:hypothetical protein
MSNLSALNDFTSDIAMPHIELFSEIDVVDSGEGRLTR